MSVFTKKAEAASKPEIPSLMDFPAYAALIQRRDSLNQRRRECEEAIAELDAKLGRRPTARDHLHSQAAALLEGKDWRFPDARADDWTRLADLRQELEVLGAALELLISRIEEERLKASRVICSRMAPAYRELVARHVRELVEAIATGDAAEDLRHQLDLGGVAAMPELAPIVYGHLGDSRDYNSGLSNFLREVIEKGFLAGREAWLPKAVRKPLEEQVA